MDTSDIMDREQKSATSWVTISGIIRLLIAFLVMFLVFLSCKKPSEPVFDSVYDEQSERFIPFADLNTSAVTGVRAQSATSGGQFANDYGKPVTQKGVCWSLVQSPTVDGSCSQDGSGLSAFTSTLSNLVADTLYYVRAYATNADGTTYGQQLSFRTLDGRAVFGQAGVTAVTATSATATATITSDGGEPITGRGVCYATTENPTTEDTCMASGTGTGDYSVTLTGLSAETAYYVRAYAFNAIRITYSEQVPFTTTGIPPTVTTGAVNNITTSGATVAGNVSAEGGSTVTARGVVWSTSQNPTVSSNTGSTASGSGTGSFSASLTGLTSGVRYYARAYATNAAGTSYGSQIEFTTTGTAPTVTTGAVSGINTTGATVAGNVTAQGSSTVSARGVCYATTQNPTTANTCVTSGSGTGAFTASLTGLTSGTRYYVRAYATNAAGTSYGSQIEFATTGSGGSTTGRDTETQVVDVRNPVTGRTWMDRNLGASRAATSSTDEQAYGDLYQWGRRADGHQKRNSATTSTLSTTDTPSHGSFILAPNLPNDWRTPQNNNQWQGVNGVNNPCPVGYRIPTASEWTTERQSWGSDNASGAFNSPLKLPIAGIRGSNSSLYGVGSSGYYWSSSINDLGYARLLYFGNVDASTYGYDRADGSTVRCLKD